MSSCPELSTALGSKSVSARREKGKKEKEKEHGLLLLLSRGRTYLIVRIGILSRVLAQNLHYASSALNPDAGARIAALRILQPFFELVRCHVYLLVEECYNLCVGFAHRLRKRERERTRDLSLQMLATDNLGTSVSYLAKIGTLTDWDQQQIEHEIDKVLLTRCKPRDEVENEIRCSSLY
jgi:hypothetical protein